MKRNTYLYLPPIILGIVGYAVSIIAHAVARRTNQRLAMPGSITTLKQSKLHAGVTLAVILPVVAAIGINAIIINDSLRLMLNGIAILLCLLYLNTKARRWAPCVDHTFAVRAFLAGSITLSLCAVGIVLIYNFQWAGAAALHGGFSKLGAGVLILLTAPFWLGMYLGAAGFAIIVTSAFLPAHARKHAGDLA